MAEKERRYPKSKWLNPNTQISIVRRKVTSPVQMHLHEYFELEIVLSGHGEQNLNGSFAIFLYTIKPCGNNLCVIKHKAITRA